MRTSDKELVSIRCPNPRSYNKHELCGHIIGGLDGMSVLLYCDICKQFYKLEVHEGGNVVLKKLDKKTRLNFVNKLKVIE